MDELIYALREAHEYAMEWGENPFLYAALYKKAADAIEELTTKYERALCDLVKQAEPPKEET